ncbi:MAG: methyl-accepting chemotaxis protein [Candidatus Eremiobacterota bacterium]
MNFIKKNLMIKLMLAFFIFSSVTVIAICYMSYIRSSSSMERIIYIKLSGSMSHKKIIITRYFQSIINASLYLSSRDGVSVMNSFIACYKKEGTSALDINTEAYKSLCAKTDASFKDIESIYKDFKDILFICSDHGHVLYSLRKGKEVGTDLVTGPYRDSALGNLWMKVMKEKKVSMCDYSYYEPAGDIVYFIGTPVLNDRNEICGVIAIRLSPEDINNILKVNIGVGKTEETYIAGKDLLARSNLISNPSAILKQKIDTEAVNRAFNNEEGSAIIFDYRNKKVLSSYAPMELKETTGLDINWVIISEVDMSEAMAPIMELEYDLLKVGFIALLLSLLISYIIAKRITSPIRKISQEAVRVGAGDLTATITCDDRTDEIGVMTMEFKKMVENLRKQTGEIIEGTTVLSTAVTEISTAIAELSTTATETAASISETTTTIEEVRQTSELSSQKAKQLSANAQKTVAISQLGKKSTEDTIEEIKKIKEQMESIAETIIKLSEQSQSIGEIIATVNDLAEQSNILAVNAAIEAVKAGEAGKGFTVVAQEVKSLAEQSKAATSQIRHILNDIQKATTAAVMAAEQGNKAVEQGVKQSAQAGEAIVTLTKGVVEAAQSSIQIEASSNQQMAGIDQVNIAMKNIKQASIHNVESARQLEDAVKSIGDLWEKLKNIVKIYKV